VARIANYFGRTASSRTIQHRDMRLDNLLFTPDHTRAHVVDWQTLGTGSGAADVAYLLGTSIADPKARAQHEGELVEGYTAELRSLDVEVDPTEVWKDYRFYAFSGLVMAIIASMNVVRTERGDEMFAVMAERSALQAIHLQSLDLLG
jgi:aminoglycoside phosphotransferase (APT) family kinase protein